MNIRRIANEVYQAMWSRPQCTLSRARNMRQEDIDRIAKAIDDAVQEALNQPVLVSEWQEQQSELTQLREQNRVLRELVQDVMNSGVTFEDGRIAYKEVQVDRTWFDDAKAALTAMSQEGQQHG